MFSYGPRPMSLFGTTTLKPKFINVEHVFLLGELSAENLVHGKGIVFVRNGGIINEGWFEKGHINGKGRTINRKCSYEGSIA